MKCFNSFFVALVVPVLFFTGCANNPPVPETQSEIIRSLQDGGLIVYLRHTETEEDYADQVTAEMGLCSTQRGLSENGWMQAKKIGEEFKRLSIPVGKVWSSEYCRAWQTADLAFGRYEKTEKLNFYPAAEFTSEQMGIMKTAAEPLLIALPAAGNTVIVGHDDVFEAVTEIYPEPQGVAYVLKPTGNEFEIMGRIGPDDWSDF